MKQKYITGIWLLLIILVLSACTGEKMIPEKLGWQVQGFKATDVDGKTVALDDLQGKVWIADFNFTSCTTVCPPMAANMAKLQEQLKKDDVPVQFVTFFIDPKRDTKKVRKNFIKKRGGELDNWHLLGNYDYPYIKNLAESSFKNAVSKPPKGSDQFTHGTSFYLINQDGTIVKKYKGTEVPYDKVEKHARILLNKHEASSNGTSSDQKAKESLQPLQVRILTEADVFQPGEANTMKIKVTKGDEAVSDASEVRFEIWKKGNKDHSKKYKVKNEGKGIYSLKHTFKKKGIYEVITHVTARSSHTMPEKEFRVGKVGEAKSGKSN